ncbi:hypothetical protein INR49_016978 [Caranx melampygus]|nr:hypothetical protein INR49_016978 [Caranx melampygus]
MDWTVVFRGGGGRGGGGARRRAEGQAGQMEDGTQHLGHCMVDMKELSANPEGLTAAGVILTPKLPQVEFSLGKSCVYSVIQE